MWILDIPQKVLMDHHLLMGMLCKDKKIVILVFFLKFLKWREYISIRTDKLCEC